MKTSKAFTATKAYLNTEYADTLTGPQRFICCALDIAYENRRISSQDRDNCKSIVQGRMGSAYTIEAWLEVNGHIKRRSLGDTAVLQRIQDYRHAWLDALIKEFKAKGD